MAAAHQAGRPFWRITASVSARVSEHQPHPLAPAHLSARVKLGWNVGIHSKPTAVKRLGQSGHTRAMPAGPAIVGEYAAAQCSNLISNAPTLHLASRAYFGDQQNRTALLEGADKT